MAVTATATAIRTIETIEAEIESAKIVYLAADADAADKVSALTAADKALAAASIAAANSYKISYAARDAHQIAATRLGKLRDELATRLQKRWVELAALRAR